jgi:hypothetical protein
MQKATIFSSQSPSEPICAFQNVGNAYNLLDDFCIQPFGYIWKTHQLDTCMDDSWKEAKKQLKIPQARIKCVIITQPKFMFFPFFSLLQLAMW